MNNHTPGPWFIDGMGNDPHCLAITAGPNADGDPSGQRESLLCEVHGTDPNGGNVRLIVQAPTMLQLLRDLREQGVWMQVDTALGEMEEKTDAGRRLDQFLQQFAAGAQSTLPADHQTALALCQDRLDRMTILFRDLLDWWRQTCARDEHGQDNLLNESEALLKEVEHGH
jgi:hypothetical protein